MQIVKKTVALLFVAVLGAMLANVSARAQESGVSVNVPFDFAVGQHALGAGSYRLEKQGAFLSIRNEDGQSLFALIVAGGGASTQGANPHLVFTRYGNEAFLNAAVFSDDRVLALARSSREKELMSRLESGEEVAVPVQ